MKDKPLWKVHEEETLLSCQIFSAIKSRRSNPDNGTEIEFLLVRGLNWVNVIALTPENEVILVKQYRPGVEKYTLELPGGCIEKDEDVKSAALREFSEETGYSSDDLEEIGVVNANPAMYNMRNYFYVARNCRKVGEQNLDSDEDVDVIKIPYRQLLEDVKSGKFDHGLCTAAIGLYELKK